jgi:hypothetical protein
MCATIVFVPFARYPFLALKFRKISPRLTKKRTPAASALRVVGSAASGVANEKHSDNKTRLTMNPID